MWVFGLVLTTTFLVAAQTPSFSNPVIYEDFPDNDVFAGPDGAYYFSASSFHYSPGAPILKSHDLINWELISHSVPRLDFGTGYDLAPGTHAYRGGIWASTMRYRPSNGLWYWLGCTNFWNNWIYTAPDATGPWARHAYLGGGNCYYDTGMLIDDDDVMYVVYGNPNVRIAQLSADAKSEVKSVSILNATDVGVDSIEGNRLYKINGTYYILNDHPGDTTYIWKSKSIWGPYESKILIKNVKPPIEGGSSPHQGSLVKTEKGDWYYMSFTWAYPAGRLPVLAPITWGSDGYPTFINGSNGGWGASYPFPDLTATQTPSWTGTYRFEDGTLPQRFEWNHDPDTSKFSISTNGLTLSTASVTTDLYRARNTLTHRIHGEFPTATVKLDISNLAEGDRTGLAAFRDRSAYIGIHRAQGRNTIVAAFNATIDEFAGNTIDNGTVVGSLPVPADTKVLWFRTNLDARPNGSRAAKFFYSVDGGSWVQLGGTYELYTNWAFFLGYRFAVFNYATVALGGKVKVEEWTVA